MKLSESIRQSLQPLNLLRHPFYQAWMEGELNREQLKNYAVQYYPHVKDFPRFVSLIHSQCEEAAGRQVLLQNLMEEEGVGENMKSHPALWVDFANGLGSTSEEVLNSNKIGSKAQALVEIFWTLCRSSYAEGLGALYSYEHQVPEIAKLKIEGLKSNFGIDDERTLAFFAVHEQADKFHSEACAALLDQLSMNDKVKAYEASTKAAQALWDFLTEVHRPSYAQ